MSQPLVLTGQRKQFLHHVRDVAWCKLARLQITDRSSLLLHGMKNIGKSTLMRLACTVASLISSRIVGVYLDYSVPTRLIAPSEVLGLALNGRLNMFAYDCKVGLHCLEDNHIYRMFFVDEVDNVVKRLKPDIWAQLGQLPQGGTSVQFWFAAISSSVANVVRMIQDPDSFLSRQDKIKLGDRKNDFVDLNITRYAPLHLFPAESVASIREFAEKLPPLGRVYSDSDLQKLMYFLGGNWGLISKAVVAENWASIIQPAQASLKQSLPESSSLEYRVLTLLAMRYMKRLVQAGITGDLSTREQLLSHIDHFNPPTITFPDIANVVARYGGGTEPPRHVLDKMLDDSIIRRCSPRSI